MFFYFDMGNVLVHFDHGIACRKLAKLATDTGLEVTALQVRQVLFDTGVHLDYECGKLTTQEFCDHFCQKVQLPHGKWPSQAALAHAASEIFWPNVSIKPLLAALLTARRRIGILSNTNPAHMEFLRGAGFPLVPDAFPVLALSYELKALKPQKEIYERAASLAGVSPKEVFFVDDNQDNVTAARSVGYDAVLYENTPQLIADMHARRVKWNF